MKHRHYKDDNAATAIAAFAILAMIVLIVVGMYIAYGGGDGYVPTMEVTFKARSSGSLYDADIEMDVANAGFVDYFFQDASTAPDVGFPGGDQKLEVKVYENNIEGDLLVHYTWHVGDMYDVNNDGMQESTWTIRFPTLKDIAPDDEGAFYLYVLVLVDGIVIGSKRVTCNPEDIGG